MIKESIYQEDTAVLNVYASSNINAKYMKQTDRTKRRNRSTMNISTPLSTIDRTATWKISKKVEEFTTSTTRI